LRLSAKTLRLSGTFLLLGREKLLLLIKLGF
jgi:hypothetical protein